MVQHTVTTQCKRSKVVAGLLVCMGFLLFLLILLPGIGIPSSAQAQGPDVPASAITRSISANVDIFNAYVFTGTQTLTIFRNVNVSLNVTISCTSPFTINATTTLSGNIPVTITYGFPPRSVPANMFMSGSGSGSQSLECPLGGGTFVLPVLFFVPVSGQVTLTTQGNETGAIVQGHGTLSGWAVVWITGSAHLVEPTPIPTPPTPVPTPIPTTAPTPPTPPRVYLPVVRK